MSNFNSTFRNYILSMNTSTSLSNNFENIMIIHLLKVVGAFHNPKGIFLHTYIPKTVRVVLAQSFRVMPI